MEDVVDTQEELALTSRFCSFRDIHPAYGQGSKSQTEKNEPYTKFRWPRGVKLTFPNSGEDWRESDDKEGV